MRSILATLFVALLFVISVRSQNKQLLYDYYEIPQSLMVNPGVKTPYKWHVGFPVLSGIGFQAGSSGISVNDLFANDGLDFNTKIRERAINRLTSRDEISFSGQIEIFNVGFRGRNRPENYYSFGMYGEGFFSFFWPQDLAILGFEGNAPNLNRQFDLGHLATQGEAVNVIHFGVNKRLNDQWTVGLRGKVYSSVADFRSIRNSGSFETTEGQNNILRNTLVADLELKTSGVQEFLDILDDDTLDQTVALQNLFVGRSLLGGNLGLGADFGFTYQLSPSTFITGSLLDVGFIYHSNGLRNFQLRGNASNEGIEIVLPDDIVNVNRDFWQELVDDIEALVPFEENTQAYLSLRPIKLNASIRHNFGQQRQRARSSSSFADCDCTPGKSRNAPGNNLDYKSAVGGHLFMINRARGPQAALTAFYQHRLGNVLALKTTYTVDKYSFSNIGLGMNLQAGPVNFYLLADNLLGYRNIAASNYASFQFGINILSWNSY